MRPTFLLILLVLPGLALAQSRSHVVDGVDRFVLTQFDRVQPKSIEENRQYCGLIAFDADAKLRATKPKAGTAKGCQPGGAPAGWDVIATFRTHGAFLDNAGSEVPTAAELKRSIASKVDDYVATPGGRVWLNVSGMGKLTSCTQLCRQRKTLAGGLPATAMHTCPLELPFVQEHRRSVGSASYWANQWRYPGAGR